MRVVTLIIGIQLASGQLALVAPFFSRLKPLFDPGFLTFFSVGNTRGIDNLIAVTLPENRSEGSPRNLFVK